MMAVRISTAEAERLGLNVKKPKRKSLEGSVRAEPKWTIELKLTAESLGWGVPKFEFRFDTVRRWRFDAAWPEKKVAFEYEGIFSNKSRHTTVNGYTGDIEKYNAAAIAGWVVIRATAKSLADGTAFWDLGRAIESRSGGGKATDGQFCTCNERSGANRVSGAAEK